MNETDELVLVRRRFEMPSHKGPTEERHRITVLMKDGSEARARRVTVDDESGVEVWKMEYWRCT